LVEVDYYTIFYNKVALKYKLLVDTKTGKGIRINFYLKKILGP